MSEAAYEADFGIPISFVFTPTSGTAFGTTQAQAQELTPAPDKTDTPKYTPISGANAAKEQFVLGQVRVGTVMIRATYGSAEHAAASIAKNLRKKGTLVITYGDGATDTYSAAAPTGISASAINADNLRTDELEFTVSLPAVFSAGTAIAYAEGTVAMTGGAGTVDFTASPFNGGTDTPINVTLTNTSPANIITVEVGGTNGYTGFGAAFTIDLGPGQSVSLSGASALSPTNCTLDISGTDTDSLSVQVRLQA